MFTQSGKSFGLSSTSHLSGLITWGILLAAVPGALAAPAELIFIRHAEKPAEGHTLSERGYLRAKQLVPFFTEDKRVTKFGPPAALYAMKQARVDSSVRAIETVQPLAEKLHLTIRADFTRDQIKKLVRQIMNSQENSGKTVVISWEHKVIMEIIKELGVTSPPAPKEWPGAVYDWAFIVDLDGKGAVKQFQTIQQNLPMDLSLPGQPDHRAPPSLPQPKMEPPEEQQGKKRKYYEAFSAEALYEKDFLSPNKKLRRSVGKKLNLYPDDPSSLFEEGLNHSDPAVRVDSALNLKFYEGKEKISLFKKALQDPSIKVRRAAAEAISGRLIDEDIKTILETLAGHAAPAVRAEAYQLMVKLFPPVQRIRRSSSECEPPQAELSTVNQKEIAECLKRVQKEP